MYEDDVRHNISTAEQISLLEQSAFGVAIQGEAHIEGDNSYVSDRAMLVASLGLNIASNNPLLPRLLGSAPSQEAVVDKGDGYWVGGSLVYDRNLSTLCGRSMEATLRQSSTPEAAAAHRQSAVDLATHFMETHTYTSRFANMAILMDGLASGVGGSDLMRVLKADSLSCNDAVVHQADQCLCDADLEAYRALIDGSRKKGMSEMGVPSMWGKQGSEGVAGNVQRGDLAQLEEENARLGSILRNKAKHDDQLQFRGAGVHRQHGKRFSQAEAH